MAAACDLQRKMVQFCRQGKDPTRVGMSTARATIYRDLIFSTIQTVLMNYYPVTYALLGEERWQQLISDFFAEYPCADPQLWKMPQGLVHYVREMGENSPFPFLADLLDFEWLEMEVYAMPDIPIPLLRSDGNLLEDIPYLNPEHRLVTYSYPVFQHLSLEVPLKKGEYPLFCFRHPETLDAHFFSLSTYFRSVIEHLSLGLSPGREALTQAAKHCRLPVTDRLLETGKQFLEHLLKKRAILGVVK